VVVMFTKPKMSVDEVSHEFNKIHKEIYYHGVRASSGVVQKKTYQILICAAVIAKFPSIRV
jgi:hypothetical protein